MANPSQERSAFDVLMRNASFKTLAATKRKGGKSAAGTPPKRRAASSNSAAAAPAARAAHQPHATVTSSQQQQQQQQQLEVEDPEDPAPPLISPEAKAEADREARAAFLRALQAPARPAKQAFKHLLVLDLEVCVCVARWGAVREVLQLLLAFSKCRLDSRDCSDLHRTTCNNMDRPHATRRARCSLLRSSRSRA
jgi:hypothetical protein